MKIIGLSTKNTELDYAKSRLPTKTLKWERTAQVHSIYTAGEQFLYHRKDKEIEFIGESGHTVSLMLDDDDETVVVDGNGQELLNLCRTHIIKSEGLKIAEKAIVDKLLYGLSEGRTISLEDSLTRER